MDVPAEVRKVEQEAAPWVRRLARLGYLAKGTVYVTVGILAARAAFVSGVHPTSTQGALERIGVGPVGRTALVVITVGLFGYALWQLVRAILNPEGYKVNAKGVAKRIGLFISGSAYLTLAYFCALLALYGRAVGRDTNSEDDWTERFLMLPLGQMIVGLGGFVAVAIAINLFYVAYSGAFMKRLKLDEHTQKRGRLVERIGQVGIAARGVVIGMVGWFFMLAAWEFKPEHAGGLGEALLAIERGPFGPWVLAVLAVGLIAYGLYEILRSHYRRIPLE